MDQLLAQSASLRRHRLVPSRQAGLNPRYREFDRDRIDHVVYDSFGNIVTESERRASGDRFKFAGDGVRRGDRPVL